MVVQQQPLSLQRQQLLQMVALTVAVMVLTKVPQLLLPLLSRK